MEQQVVAVACVALNYAWHSVKMIGVKLNVPKTVTGFYDYDAMH